jgi:hypothetical protein
MSQPSLPPRGVVVPTQIIFHPELPSAVLVTWIKLRSLAWEGWSTQPMSIPQLAAYLGIHPARLNRHLAQLQELSSLSYRNLNREKIIISFPEESISRPTAPIPGINKVDPVAIDSERTEQSFPASYFPARILGYISYYDEDDAQFPGEIRAQVTKKPSRMTICTPEEPALLAR